MDTLRQRSPDDGAAVMYCNYKEKDTQTLENLIASLWRQLVHRRPISTKAKDLYRKHEERRTRPSIGEVMQVLRFEIDCYSRLKVFIVINTPP